MNWINMLGVAIRYLWGIRIGPGRGKKRPCPILVKERLWREGSIGNSFRRGFLGERGKSWEERVQGVVRKKDDQETPGSFDCRVLGSSAFVEKLLVEEGKVIQKGALLKRKRVDVEGLLNLIGREFGGNTEEMIGGGRGK